MATQNEENQPNQPQPQLNHQPSQSKTSQPTDPPKVVRAPQLDLWTHGFRVVRAITYRPGRKAAHATWRTIPSARSVSVCPAEPELLYSIGAYHSAESEPWWTVDPALVMKWTREMGRLQHLYMMREYPSPSDWQHKTIVMTSLYDNVKDGTRTSLE
ncbi:hypothetical protein RUM44_011011 [Polyplax serrata]|uniref:Uncharacterized protein n=1 Tax=Polyplax serrata TaxID=468196 RepID=A0ABR1ANT9_POLSC